jgi:large subunit ribosomal protein L4
MEATIYNQKGKKAGSVKLPEKVFALPWNSDLVHQVVVSMRSNMRTSIAHSKDRSDVRGGGRKPWRQKGTGRARHGSRRSPIWKGGGVTHGPRKEKNYEKKINKKMKAKALYTILSRKFKDGEIIFVDDLKIAKPQTKEAKEILNSFSKVKGYEEILSKRNNSALFSLSEKDKNVELSFKNFGNIEIDQVKNLNPSAILNYKYLLIENPENSIKFLESKLGIKEKPKVVKKKVVKKK